jgi:hypothetical protein
MRNRALALIHVAVLMTLSSCSTPWQVVQQEVPNPFYGQTEFEIKQLNLRGVTVDEMSLAEFESKLNEKDLKSWLFYREQIEPTFLETAKASAQKDGVVLEEKDRDSPYRVAVQLHSIIVGRHMQARSGSIWGKWVGKSSFGATLKIQKRSGRTLDEIEINVEDGGTYSKGGRVLNLAGKLGDIAASYVYERTSTAPDPDAAATENLASRD